MVDRIAVMKLVQERMNRERLMARVDKRNATDEHENKFTRFVDKVLKIREPLYITYEMVVAETDKGICLRFQGLRAEPWLPKSMIKVNFKTKTLMLPKSLAHDRKISHLAVQGSGPMDET